MNSSATLDPTGRHDRAALLDQPPDTRPAADTATLIPTRGAHVDNARTPNRFALAEIVLGSRDGDRVVVGLDDEWLPPLWLTLLDRAALGPGHVHRTTSTYRRAAYDVARGVYVYQLHNPGPADAS